MRGKASTCCLRKHSWTWYSDLINKCSNPYCKSKSKLEVHHIQPLYCDGKDEFINCVVLCADCHKGLKFHSEWEYYYTVILNWKIKSDKDVFNKIPNKYKKLFGKIEFIFNKNLICLDENEDETIYEAKVKAYQVLLKEKEIIKRDEYSRCLKGYNQICFDYEFFHGLLKEQIFSCYY